MAFSITAPLFLLLARPLLSMAQQQPVISDVPFLGYDINSPIDASIIDVQDSVVTMSLACAAGTDSNDCGLAPVQALIYGQNTYLMALSDGTDFTATQDCMISGSTAPATCTEFATGDAANNPGMSTSTYDASDISFVPVTVTGGADLLTAIPGAAAVPTSDISASLTVLTGASMTPTASMTGDDTATTMDTTSAPTQSASSSSSSVSAQTSATPGFAAGPLVPGLGGMAGMLVGLLGYVIV
nr:hypothetical protein CFP56_57680 [Quercus suber]